MKRSRCRGGGATENYIIVIVASEIGHGISLIRVREHQGIILSMVRHPTIGTFPPMIIEVYKAKNKIKAGKAPGICGVYPEYIHHGDNDALHTSYQYSCMV